MTPVSRTARRFGARGALLAAVATLFVTAPALADNDDWRNGHHRGHHQRDHYYVEPAPRVIYQQPRYYAPPPPRVIYAPPPPVYYAPPPVYYAPAPVQGPSLNVTVPLRF